RAAQVLVRGHLDGLLLKRCTKVISCRSGEVATSADIRFGSKADIAASPIDVGYFPECRHRSARSRCPCCARKRANLNDRPHHFCSNKIRLCGVGGSDFVVTFPNPAAWPIFSNSRAVYASPCGVEPNIWNENMTESVETLGQRSPRTR